METRTIPSPAPLQSPGLGRSEDVIEQLCWDAGVLTLVSTQGFRKAATEAFMERGYRLATISRDFEPFDFAACSPGKRVRFMTTTGLVTQLLEQPETRTLQRLHKQLERLYVLILDELGYVPFSKTGAELLFDVVSRAYELNSPIVTTNLPFEQWTEVMGGERLTGALLDRLTHRVHILEANGQSYRLTNAKRRLKRKQA